jgi:antirestriction protein ArdC
MSTYKPLSERIANQMIAELKANTSIFQRPENNNQSAMPFNLASGNRYPGSSALTLLMQKRDDPRWATFEQANRNRTAVNKNVTGTFINFKTQYEYQQAFKDGEPVLKQNGKPRYDRVRLDEPKEVTAKVFNAEQMRKMPAWEKEPSILSSTERAEIMLGNSKVTIEHGGDDMLYDKATDTIIIPEKEQFASPEQYVAEALHQLVHRELQTNGEDHGMVKEELRANLASLFLSKELNLPYELNYHVGYANSWAQLLKDEPGELFQAADDAQKVMDRIMNLERELDVKQQTETGQEIENELQTQAAESQQAKSNPNKLEPGDIIRHKGNEFTVLSEQKNKTLKMQDASGDKFPLKPKDGLYSALLHARNNPLEQAQEMEQGIAEEEAMAEEQEEETDYSISR